MAKPVLPVDTPFDLNPIGSWPSSSHVFDQISADAILMAWAAERPLLVRGEPGTGKSQLARAAAQKLNRAFISEVVHARTEPQDLQWRFDTVGRLGEAQALAARGAKSPAKGIDALDPRHFLSPGPLWWAFDWQSARHCQAGSRYKTAAPATPDGWTPEAGCVLLIDEIDKADSDVPNSLLETLGNRSFSVPWLAEGTVGQGTDTPPLVIITTNEERELPAAFLRRCLVLQYELPDDIVPWLIARGRIHFSPEVCSNDVLEAAARQLAKDRIDARRAGVTRPGQAEYLDLLKALSTLRAVEAEQLDLLKQISRFAYRKFREDKPRGG